METNSVNEKRIKAGNISLIAAYVIETLALWNEYVWYEAVAPYGTLISFVFLCITFVLNY